MLPLFHSLYYISLFFLIIVVFYKIKFSDKNSRSLKDPMNLLLVTSSVLFSLSLLNSFVFYKQNNSPHVTLLPYLFLIIYFLLIWISYLIYRRSFAQLRYYSYPVMALSVLYVLTAIATLYSLPSISILLFSISMVSLLISALFLLKKQKQRKQSLLFKFTFLLGLVFAIVSYNATTSIPGSISSEKINSSENQMGNDTTEDSENVTSSDPPSAKNSTSQESDESQKPNDQTSEKVVKIFDKNNKYYADYVSTTNLSINKTVNLNPSFTYTINQIELGEVLTYQPFVKEIMLGAEPVSVLKVSATVHNKSSQDYYYSFASTFVDNGFNEYSSVGKFTLNKSYSPDTELPLLQAGTKDNGDYYIFMNEPVDTLRSLTFLIGLPTNPLTGDTISSTENPVIKIAVN